MVIEMKASQCKKIQAGSAVAQGAKVIPWSKHAQLGSYYEAETLAAHALLQAQAGFEAMAKKTFRRALSAAQKVEGFHWRDKLFGNIAILQAQAGLFSDAIHTAKKVEELNQCAEALTVIASLEEEAGSKLKTEPWVPSPP